MTATHAAGRVAAAFAHGRAEGRLTLVGYLPLGDPHLGGRKEAIARDLVDAGVDMLELGLPWRRPLLDSAIIAGARRRAGRRCDDAGGAPAMSEPATGPGADWRRRGAGPGI